MIMFGTPAKKVITETFHFVYVSIARTSRELINGNVTAVDDDGGDDDNDDGDGNTTAEGEGDAVVEPEAGSGAQAQAACAVCAASRRQR
jgi:hypothetical protein